MQVTSMKRFCVVLILVVGLALSNALAAAEVIRGKSSESKKIGNAELAKVVVQHPASMGDSKGERFQKRNVLPKYSVARKSSATSVKIMRLSGKKSKVPLRKFPVVKVDSSSAR